MLSPFLIFFKTTFFYENNETVKKNCKTNGANFQVKIHPFCVFPF